MERSVYEGRRTPPRVGFRFERFSRFCKEHGEKCSDGMVWEPIASLQPMTEECGKVYDFTVDDEHHNFVANGFVVSNCGVRMVRSNLFFRDVKNQSARIGGSLVPHGPHGRRPFGQVQLQGQGTAPPAGGRLPLCRRARPGEQGDIDYTEAHGRLDGADPDLVSDHAKKRGAEQCGTLGSGNHFLEVQVVDQVFDEDAAKVMGLEKDMVCVMIHSGSRGLGYQVCDDALAMLRKAPEKYGIDLPDRQLACAPVNSPEGQKYIAAMRAAANFAWCNRQLLMQQAREVFADVFGRPWQEMQMNLVYDVCHNIAKFEEHTVAGKTKKVWVHRKGATRAFPPGHPEIPPHVPQDRPAGHHPRRHGPGQLGAGRPAGKHGEDVRHDLPRGGPGDEPHRRESRRAGRRIDKELEARGRHRPGAEPQGSGGGAAQCVQERR